MAEQVVATRPLRPRDVAEILGVHINTVKRLEPAELPYFTVTNRRDRRYWPADVEAYLAARRVG